jgi:tetratricopeptide (TPR) repeat protein
MKAEERKQLQTNSLVQFIGRVKHNLKTGPSRRTVVIWGIVALGVLVFASWKFFSWRSTRNNSERWVNLDELNSPSDLDEYIQKNEGTVQARVARLQKARDDLKKGLEDLFIDRKGATEKLEQAVKAFDELKEQFRSMPTETQLCLLGAAKGYEGLGQFDEALARYQELKKRFPDSVLTKSAETRIAFLSDKKHQEELKQLLEQKK